MSSIAYTTNRRTVLPIILGMLVSSILMVVAHVPVRSGLDVFMVVIGVLYFGLCGSVIRGRLRRGGRMISVTDDGVDIRPWGHVRWNEVTAIRVRVLYPKRPARRWVQIELADPGATVARLGLRARLLMLVNRRWGRYILVSPELISASAEEIVAAMQEAHQRFLGSAAMPSRPSGS